ncbi:ArsR family transcriptional regulator [Paenibacillus macerans]|uniref:ArsR family transcriptional regulator n=1 Tax=Paenibacillus macerans TaxID=44252 RepID=UPI003D317C7E
MDAGPPALCDLRYSLAHPRHFFAAAEELHGNLGLSCFAHLADPSYTKWNETKAALNHVRVGCLQMQNVKELKTLEEIRIYSDPYRIQIMDVFQRLNRPATMKEVADAMGEVPAKVYYHAKKLASIGLLQLVNTKVINGITAKYYEPFQGHIHITKSRFDDTIKPAALSETEKLLSHIYDESKKKFLKTSRAESAAGQLTSQHAYLTAEEAEAFNAWMSEFLEKHQNKASEASVRYDIFLAVAKSSESEE